MSEVEIGSDGYISPLKTMIYETHEIYVELLSAGYPADVAVAIIAAILADAIGNRAEYGDDEEDEEEDDDTDDDEFTG